MSSIRNTSYCSPTCATLPAHFERNNIPKPNVYMGGTSSVFAEARISLGHLEVVLSDLSARGLADGGSWNTMMTESGAWAPRTTPLGNQLLDFVTTVDFSDDI